MEELNITRTMPNSLEAEQSVIGSMIWDRQAIITAGEMLMQDDFYYKQYGIMFQAMVEMNNEGKPVDVVTLQEKLKEKDVPPEVYSLEFVRELLSSVPTSANIRQYATIVKDKSILRNIIKVNEKIANDCYAGKDSTEDILAETEKRIFELVRNKGASDYTPIDKVVLEALDKISTAAKNRGVVTGVPTGFKDLDSYLSGLQPSDFVLVAARPSMGKTAFVLNVAENVAIKQGITTAVFSLEMSNVQLVNRMLSLESSVDADKLRKGRLDSNDWGKLIEGADGIAKSKLIIDDTPEAVILSGFDPIRREVARIALEKLIVDGRIHPARIEEMVEKAQKEVETMIREEGEAATLEVGVHGIHPELVRLLGRMKFRTSYGQNALKHSIEVAQLSGLLAAEIGVDVRTAKRAGLLHDIGKSVDHDMEGSHIQIGVDLCRKYKESPIIINAVEAHHGDVEPESLIACIVQAADTISAARPGARRETLDTYTNRLKQLEDISNGFKGVEKSFAIQAGREIRIMVVPEQISDADMVLLARNIAKQIESELEYPGQIKVNVIRESRVTDFAK